MRVLPIFLILLFVIGCTERKLENGLNLTQLEAIVDQKEKTNFEDLKYIFKNYDLVLYDHQSMRSSTFFYLVERNGFFNMEEYRQKVVPKFKEKGWTLVKKNDYGELYCNKDSQAIGVTFPNEKKELEGLNVGYYTYQFHKKISITFDYNSNGKSNNCPNNLVQNTSI